MRRSHILEEINLRTKLFDAQLDLYKFYIDKHHISKVESAKRVFKLTDDDIDRNLKMMVKEKNLVKSLIRNERKIK